MRKIILIAGLIAMSLPVKLRAQEDNQPSYIKRLTRSKTEQTFSVWEPMVNIRDYVVLKEGRLILDLAREDDYDNFKNLDSLLTEFKKDIAFYKDSLNANPTGNMRIDYVMNTEYSFKKIRFKKYNADGSIFMNRDNEISRLKFEPDTVRIIIQKSRPGLGSHRDAPCSIPYSIQATFVLGNYYDIDRVLDDKILNSTIDTLRKSLHHNGNKKVNSYQSTILYNPYTSGQGRLVRYSYLLNNEYATVRDHKARNTFTPQFGIGLIRNTFTPTFDAGFQHNWSWISSQHNFWRISGTGYYFFEKNPEGGYKTNDNWFINACIGSIDQYNNKGWVGKEFSLGVGYLVSSKGDYFKGTTIRLYTNIMLVKGLSLVPEIIATDNFKQFFPGMTFKIFP